MTFRLYSFKIDRTMATIIRLAVDGIVFTRAFNINVLDQETGRDVSDALSRLTALPDSQNQLF